MIKNKEIFDVNPLDPEVLQTHIHNQLVNIVHNIELQTDKLYDVYKENVPVSAVYPIRVKILEEKKYLEILIETLDMVRKLKEKKSKDKTN